MSVVVTEVLARRRDRSIAILLGLKEKECDKFLPKDVQSKLRKAVLDQINEFYDLAVDVIRSLDNDEVVLNEEYLSRLELKLDRIHAHITDQ